MLTTPRDTLANDPCRWIHVCAPVCQASITSLVLSFFSISVAIFDLRHHNFNIHAVYSNSQQWRLPMPWPHLRPLEGYLTCGKIVRICQCFILSRSCEHSKQGTMTAADDSDNSHASHKREDVNAYRLSLVAGVLSAQRWPAHEAALPRGQRVPILGHTLASTSHGVAILTHRTTWLLIVP